MAVYCDCTRRGAVVLWQKSSSRLSPPLACCCGGHDVRAWSRRTFSGLRLRYTMSLCGGDDHHVESKPIRKSSTQASGRQHPLQSRSAQIESQRMVPPRGGKQARALLLAPHRVEELEGEEHLGREEAGGVLRWRAPPGGSMGGGCEVERIAHDSHQAGGRRYNRCRDERRSSMCVVAVRRGGSALYRIASHRIAWCQHAKKRTSLNRPRFRRYVKSSPPGA